MVAVEQEWRLEQPPARALADLLGTSALWRDVPGLEPATGPRGTGRLRVRLGTAQVTLTGRSTLRALRDQGEGPVVVWETEGRRVRGPGTARVSASLRLLPHDAGTLVRVAATAVLEGWEPAPPAPAVEATLRRLVQAARRGATGEIATTLAATGDTGSRLPSMTVAPAASAPSREPDPDRRDRIWRAARDRWPIGVMLGAGAALAVWVGSRGRRGSG
ncbi:MAG TPA: hypothetical protein VMW47_02565 [Verrucomicrobiae bacterium]|nr:hypothetical protein [Verrucomicrobiae bacterium]